MWTRSQRLINIPKLVEVEGLSACKIVFLSTAECKKEKGGGKEKLRSGKISLLSIYPHFNFASSVSIYIFYSSTLA